MVEIHRDHKIEMNLTVSDLTFKYPNSSRSIIENMTFQAKPGDIFAIEGESGCGKTTLLNIICGVIPKVISGRFKGEVKYGDRDLTDLNLPEISKYISLLMPDPDLQLFFPVVEHELAFGPENLKLSPEEISSRIKETLDLLEIGDLRFEQVSNLSFGQKKIVSLGALLSLSPNVYLLDEPSAGLSAENVSKIKSIILKLANKQKIIFIADHNPEILDIAKKKINLS